MKTRILSILLSLCIVLTFIPAVVSAEETDGTVATSGTCGEGVTWVFDETTGTLTISGEGAIQDCNGGQPYQPWGDLYADIKKIVIEPGVTAIGQEAFAWLDNLEQVTLPEGLTTVGPYAFYWCSKLADINIPESVTTIGIGAFSGIVITSVTIPGSVETIDDSAFGSCAQLTEVVIEEGVVRIGQSVFINCASLVSVTLPESLTTIDATAFSNCRKLPEITFPSGVTSLGSQAFCAYDGNTSLTKISFEGDAPTIAEDCFLDVTATVYYPAGNETWTEDVLLGYGGTLTWESYCAAHNYEVVSDEAACTEAGSKTFTCTLCGDSYTEEVPALGHDYEGVTPVYDEETRTHDYDCTRCDTLKNEDCTFDEGTVSTEATPTALGEKKYTCAVCGGSYVESYVLRIYGENRFETAFAIADILKEQLGADQFETIIVAYGWSFPDALSGSYLAAVKDAPILISDSDHEEDVKAYISENLAPGGTVYLLGGVNALPKSMEEGLEGFTVKRLSGDDRFETNLAILEEAGVEDQEILVCSGWGFADSLSASAAGKPILLVDKTLTDEQKAFLETSSGEFIIIGGTSAVSAGMQTELEAYGSILRLGGDTRYETSVLVAERFFEAPTSAVLAYAWNFPDGLCGGPLAYQLGAPLTLTANGEEGAAEYAADYGIAAGAVLGGSGLISDVTATNVFGQ